MDAILFKPISKPALMFLEQAQGNIVLPKRIEKPLAEQAAALVELIATYRSAAGQMAEIANFDGEVTRCRA
jgi:hypothetical protein